MIFYEASASLSPRQWADQNIAESMNFTFYSALNGEKGFREFLRI